MNSMILPPRQVGHSRNMNNLVRKMDNILIYNRLQI